MIIELHPLRYNKILSQLNRLKTVHVITSLIIHAILYHALFFIGEGCWLEREQMYPRSRELSLLTRNNGLVNDKQANYNR